MTMKSIFLDIIFIKHIIESFEKHAILYFKGTNQIEVKRHLLLQSKTLFVGAGHVARCLLCEPVTSGDKKCLSFPVVLQR
jgi:hypothetical protein